ncbi:hypothetical protein SAMN05216338_1009119 [Bradyrhizobium sp. Rc2d]|nr:hypothetical protein SAMN05216338_1009119 [Bradyrhizobium sp. Rc2d]
MRALHRVRAGELPAPPVRAGLFALTRRAASTIRRCRGLQAKQCGQLSDCAKCKTRILRPGRGTDVDPCDETSHAILLPTPVRRVIVDSHSACVLGLRRRAAPSTTSSRLTLPHLILCAGALRPYPDAVMPCQQSLHHYRNEAWTCAICRSCILARAASRSPSAPSACQAWPVNECREKPQTYVADVISGLPGMDWDIIVWHDEETGLDQLTAHLQQQLRPAPSAPYGTLPGKASGYVWIAMTRGKRSRSSSGGASRLASSAVSPLAGVTATTRRAGPARRSNQMTGHLQRCSQRSIPSIPPWRSFRGTCLPPSPFGDHACAPCLVQQPFVLAPRLPSRERGSTTQPLLPCI